MIVPDATGEILDILYIHTVPQPTTMRRRRPLTAAELAEIYDRNPTPAALTLLREIHRLRAMIMRADQVRKMIADNGRPHLAGSVWECFERELDAEPCLTDPPTPRQQEFTAERKRMIEEWQKNGRRR